MLKEALVLIIGSAVLAISAKYAVRSSTHLARALRLTEFVTSFLLVAFIAALPDAVISITAAIQGTPDLGVGALLGGNIADLTLILGLVILVGKQIKVHSTIIRRDWYFAALALLPIILGIDGTLTRIDGTILLTAGISFFALLLKEKKYFHKPYKNGNKLFYHGTMLLASLALLIASAHYIVEAAATFAHTIGVPTILIGVLVVALGTTLPEFMFSLQSIKKGHADLALGDLLGNVVIDACILMGIITLIAPITVEPITWMVLSIFTLFTVIFALTFMRTGNTLTKDEALALVLFYIAFIITNIIVR